MSANKSVNKSSAEINSPRDNHRRLHEKQNKTKNKSVNRKIVRRAECQVGKGGAKIQKVSSLKRRLWRNDIGKFGES